MEEMCLLDTSAKSSLLNLAKAIFYLRARWEGIPEVVPCSQESYGHLGSPGPSAEAPRTLMSLLEEVPGTVIRSYYSSVCSQPYGSCDWYLFLLMYFETVMTTHVTLLGEHDYT